MGKLTIETIHKMKSEEAVAAEGSTLMGAIAEYSFLYASGVLFAFSVAVVSVSYTHLTLPTIYSV